MAFYSNYPSGGAYPPPSSGPPPPPGSYGMSAYNVNQYGYGVSQGYGGYPYGQGGAVQGFTVPAVQHCHSMSLQQPSQQAPAAMETPPSVWAHRYDSHLMQYQMELQKQMMEMCKAQLQQNDGHSSRQSGGDGSKVEETAKSETCDEDAEKKLKEMMRTKFIDELMRRQAVSGTFEMTEGTVKPLKKYPAEDPVVQWYKTNRSEDKTDQPWDKEVDCEYLREAMKGVGTNEAAITHVVATRCNNQRQELKNLFKTMYGRDLIQDIKSELSGDYRESVMACFVSPVRYDAWCIKEAIYGPGTNEQALIEILMTRTNAQIMEMRNVYADVVSPNRKKPDSQIEKDITDDTSGDFKRLLISAAQGNRYEIERESLERAVEEICLDSGQGTGMFQVNYEKLCDKAKTKRDAQRLFEAGEKRWGTDEEIFNLIFSTRDYYTLRTIWQEYVKISQRDIVNSVDRETSGDFKAGLRAIITNIRCRPMFFAQQLKKAMKGLGTDDSTLIRIIVSRSEIDMVQIKECFLELTKQTLWNWLDQDCSGDYRKLLQAIVGRN